MSLASLKQQQQIGMQLSSNYAFAVVVDNRFGCFLEYVEDYIDEIEDNLILDNDTIDAVADNSVVETAVEGFVLDLAKH